MGFAAQPSVQTPATTAVTAQMRYTSSITAGSLKVPESRVIAGLMLRGLKGKAFRQAISVENVLQARSENTSKSLANLIRRRLQHLPEPMLKLVRDGSVIEATHACLAAAIMDSFLLGDFLDLVMRPLYRTFKENLPLSSWRECVCQPVHQGLAGTIPIVHRPGLDTSPGR